MAEIAVRTRKIDSILTKSLNSCANRGYSSPSVKNTSMTAARLTVIDKQDPSSIPVMTSSGRTRFSIVRLIRHNSGKFVNYAKCTLDCGAQAN